MLCDFVFNCKRRMDYTNVKGEEKTGTSVLVYPLLKAIKSYRILLAFIWRCKIAPCKERWTEKNSWPRGYFQYSFYWGSNWKNSAHFWVANGSVGVFNSINSQEMLFVINRSLRKTLVSTVHLKVLPLLRLSPQFNGSVLWDSMRSFCCINYTIEVLQLV